MRMMMINQTDVQITKFSCPERSKTLVCVVMGVIMLGEGLIFEGTYQDCVSINIAA